MELLRRQAQAERVFHRDRRGQPTSPQQAALPDADAEARIASLITSEVAVAAVEAEKIAGPLAAVVRAFIDQPKSERSKSLFLLCEGASELAEVKDRELSRISYWSFLP